MDVVGIDNVCLDLIVQIDKIPDSNSFEHMHKRSWQGGGKVPTALVALGRLGIESGLMGYAGDDPFGDFCLQDLNRHKVDTSRMITKGVKTVLSICLAEKLNGARSFISQIVNDKELIMECIDAEYIISAKYLHLANMNHACVEAAKIAKANGVRVVMDGDHYNQKMVDNIGLIDVFIGSEFFYDVWFKDKDFEKNCRAVREMGPQIVVFTFGEKGCIGMDDEGYFELPAFTQIDVMDTTGAGDVFHGAFIYGLLQGWNAKETARFASAVSAIKCTRLGGRAGIPDVATTERFLKDGYIDYTSIDERVRFYEDAIFTLMKRG